LSEEKGGHDNVTKPATNGISEREDIDSLNVAELAEQVKKLLRAHIMWEAAYDQYLTH
jgi:hypothetical protein